MEDALDRLRSTSAAYRLVMEKTQRGGRVCLAAVYDVATGRDRPTPSEWLMKNVEIAGAHALVCGETILADDLAALTYLIECDPEVFAACAEIATARMMASPEVVTARSKYGFIS